MNLNARKAKIVWVEVVDGKEKKVSKSFDLFSEEESEIKNALQGLVGLCENTNAAYYFTQEYEIV
ncbi:MAG TPA: hypothetical protein PLO45_05820 [Defluviitoga sp.]|nr:hypothetical protein [Defluviitoga sp.]